MEINIVLIPKKNIRKMDTSAYIGKQNEKSSI